MKYDRFLKVARYNLAINRALYLKMAVSLFLVMALPLLLFIVKTIWTMGITRNVDYALAATIPGSNIRGWMQVSFIFAMPVICGYMFHNLLTKQTRTKELTLPASNGEKFLFHALMTVGGAFVVYFVSFFVIDLLQYLYVALVFGISHATFFPYKLLFFSYKATGCVDPITAFMGDFWLGFILKQAWVAYFSTYILGNAIKYKYNVLWTYVFHVALGFVSMALLGLSMPMIIGADWTWLQNIELEKAMLFFRISITLFFSFITIFCWWMSYRLYCRAQITTRRNP